MTIDEMWRLYVHFTQGGGFDSDYLFRNTRDPRAGYRDQQSHYYKDYRRTPIHTYEVDGIHYEVFDKEG